jgi:hypothetical protein
VKKWPEKDREEFLRDIKGKDETNMEKKKESANYGEENDN